LRVKVGKAIGEYRMVEDGDVVMVCLSGVRIPTRCSTCAEPAASCAVSFELWRQSRPEAARLPRGGAAALLDELGVRYRIVEEDTYSVVKRVIEPAKPCAGCARGCAAGVL